jgi:Family of unknown function (DUF5996)
MERNMTRAEPWPSLPLAEWSDTCTTLHLWTQIVGKIRLAQTPWTNHSWHVTLEVSSCGFWPGGGVIAYPAYYSYAYPEPKGFPEASIKPVSAFYSTDLREFILPYDDIRKAKSPDDTLLDFLQTTYEAAATLANWDRASLEGLRYL